MALRVLLPMLFVFFTVVPSTAISVPTFFKDIIEFATANAKTIAAVYAVTQTNHTFLNEMLTTHATKHAELTADVESYMREYQRLHGHAKELVGAVGMTAKSFNKWYPKLLESVQENKYARAISCVRKLKIAITLQGEQLIKYVKSYKRAMEKVNTFMAQAKYHRRNTEWWASWFDGWGWADGEYVSQGGTEETIDMVLDSHATMVYTLMTTASFATGAPIVLWSSVISLLTYQGGMRYADYLNNYREYFRRVEEVLKHLEIATEEGAYTLMRINGTMLAADGYLDDIKGDLECGPECSDFVNDTINDHLMGLFKKLGQQSDEFLNKYD